MGEVAGEGYGPPQATLASSLHRGRGPEHRRGPRHRPGRPAPVAAAKTRRKQGDGALPYVMIAPLVVFIGALAIYPTVLTVIEAFVHNDPLTGPNHFAGFANFTDVFNNPEVRQSMVNTGWYALFGVVLTVGLGTVVALLLQRPFRGRGVILAIIVLPWALPGVVEGVIWSWIYNPTTGVLNSVLKSLHLIGQYQLFIGSHQVETILLIALVQAWQITPLAALIVLAALQSIPDELYEAASVDGASWYRVISRVTLPLVRPALAIATVEALVMSLNIFDQVYVLNANSTTGSSLMSTTYFITFQDLNFGDGYALSLLATVVTVVLAVGIVKLLYRKVEYS
ncbi:MAG TPA: sugar ABC transporter permease [Acidimicrobiales bacterium]|nr:sugar ABC transporter permease [Acidimicrobiales bacterium]